MSARQTHLRRVAYALTGDWHRAEDLLQTAFVKLYVAWPRLRDPNAAEAYARRTLVRANIDESRRPWRRERTLPRRARRGGAGRDVVRGALRALVDGLQQLPPMQRKVVVLRHMLDLSVSETASELGISEGTVKSHTSRGMDALRGGAGRAGADNGSVGSAP